MYVMIDKKFGIKSDENNFILFQLKVYGNKSKHAGENYIETIGYYNKLTRALTAGLNLSIMNDKSLTTLNKILLKLNKIGTVINKIEKGIKND